MKDVFLLHQQELADQEQAELSRREHEFLASSSQPLTGPCSPKDIVSAVQEAGTMLPLEGYVRLKRLEAEVTSAIEQLKSSAIKAAAEYGKGEHEAFGAVIQCKSGAGRWDFSRLPWFSNLNTMMKAKQEAAKAAYNAKQKLMPLPVDLETGEEIQPASYTPGSEIVSISLKK